MAVSATERPLNLDALTPPLNGRLARHGFIRSVAAAAANVSVGVDTGCHHPWPTFGPDEFRNAVAYPRTGSKRWSGSRRSCCGTHFLMLRLPDRMPTLQALSSASSSPAFTFKPVSRDQTANISRRCTPSHSQNSMLDTPHAPPEVTRVGLTARAACTPFGGCDDEPPQAHSRGWV